MGDRAMERRFNASTRQRHAASGQALVIFALFSLVLVGALALATDVGYLLAQRRQTQNAVDAAALAADKAVQRNQLGAVQATGQQYAAANGIANGGANAVTISYPPVSGAQAGSDRCVEATATQGVQKFFVAAVYAGPWQVTARAVACTELVDRPYAVMALDPGGSGITSGGSSYLAISAGGAYSAADVDICGTASWLQADGPLDAAQGLKICANATVDAETRNGAAPPTTDPLASLSQPTTAQCGVIRANPNIKNSDPATISLAPGNYTNGITINANNKVISFASGVYCFGQDLKTNGGAHGNLLQGRDVLFYFRASAMLNIDGGGNDVQLDAGPGGACTLAMCVAQIVIAYDRSNCSDLWLVGGNATHLDGIIYAPCSLVHLGGDAGSDLTGQVIAGAVAIKGGAHLTITYEQDVVTRIPLVYLVE
jgi:Flp pilus assembly protein TadG